MRYFQLLSFLVCMTPFSIASPISLESRAAGDSGDRKPSANSVSQAADNFAKDAGIVSNALNTLPTMTDRNQIESTAREAFNAESDEDNQRSVLFAAAGQAGADSNNKILRFTPVVLDGLDAIARSGTLRSIQDNLPTIERARNPNILPSITQLSSAALDAVGVNRRAKDLPATTGTNRLARTGNNNNGGNNDNNNDNANNNGGNRNNGDNRNDATNGGNDRNNQNSNNRNDATNGGNDRDNQNSNNRNDATNGGNDRNNQNSNNRNNN